MEIVESDEEEKDLNSAAFKCLNNVAAACQGDDDISQFDLGSPTVDGLSPEMDDPMPRHDDPMSSRHDRSPLRADDNDDDDGRHREDRVRLSPPVSPSWSFGAVQNPEARAAVVVSAGSPVLSTRQQVVSAQNLTRLTRLRDNQPR